MGKRSSFDRLPRDFYPTPIDAARPLLPHLAPRTVFAEPCAGDGALIRHLESAGHYCPIAWDIEPQDPRVEKVDALSSMAVNVDCYITNPPWARCILHPLIEWLGGQGPTWLLFDADWMHTRQSAPFMPMLRKIVSVGRVKWIPDSPFTGKDNCCWYLFDATVTAPAQFVGRAA